VILCGLGISLFGISLGTAQAITSAAFPWSVWSPQITFQEDEDVSGLAPVNAKNSLEVARAALPAASPAKIGRFSFHRGSWLGSAADSSGARSGISAVAPLVITPSGDFSSSVFRR